MRSKRDDHQSSSGQESSSSASAAPGKTTRTSKLPSRSGTQGRGAAAQGSAPVQAKSAPGFAGWTSFGGGFDAGQSVLRKAEGGSAGPAVDAGAVYAQATSGSGTEIPHRADMEKSFGTDFSNVQAYTGRSGEMGSIGAEAATLGSDSRVAFASASPSKETVAHELAHVVQARNGAGSSGVQASSAVSQPGDAAEREADAVASKVASGQTVNAGELRAQAAGVQRKDVTVSAGTGQTETESTTRVLDHGNNFEDEMNAWTKLLAWKNAQSITFARNGAQVTRAPTDQDALFFFIELTPAQRNDVWMDKDGVLKHIFARFTAAESARVMGMCDFPLRWKIIHWFRDISASGGGRDTIRSMISNSPLGQRLDVVQDEQCIELMVTTFGDDHPENLFGDVIKAQLYPDDATQTTFDQAHPKFAAWRNKAEKLDAEARWAFVGQSPVANITSLKGQTAAGGRTKWTSLIHWGPRGMALSPTMRENIDKAALDSGVTGTDRADLFLVRWNTPLNDPGANYNAFKTVWTNLQRMPLATITSDVVHQIELRITTSGGAYTDYPTSGGFGDIWVGTNTSLSYVGHTVRHEVGHAADTKLGGFANFSSKPPIVWKKWWTEQPWLQEMMRYMDAPTSGPEGQAFLQLMQAAMSSGTFNSPFGAYTGPSSGTLTPEQQQQKLWHEVATTYNSQGIQQALQRLKTAGKHTASPATVKKIVDDGQGSGTHPTAEPGYIRDRYFLKKYGEHFSYHKTGGQEVWANSKLRDYTLCSPYEYYADMFAAYFETDTNRDANIPSWAAPYFKQLESMYDAKAADDPNNRRSTAYGNSFAPGLE